jgi:ATP-dependent DNA helicase RecQ
MIAPPHPAAAADPRALLKNVFGYDAFRPLQQDIIEATLDGRDVLAILPTGAGKSLCYQLPALVRGGLTLVVSPLIALMKDQVDQLQAAGVAATFLNSSLSADERDAREADLAAGRIKLLYLAPERLMAAGFAAKLDTWNLAAIAVDEAHCISEWGHDFRPEYRQLATLRQRFPTLPLLALTATATPQVRADLVTQLRLGDPAIFVSSFNRPNLNYRVVAKAAVVEQVAEFATARREESGIVYCQARKTTESMAAALRAHGLPAVAYHAGMEPAERAANQDAFLRDEARIVCATVAFGMGINKPNVRWVIHADLPKNVEGYYQETGRAGRDSLPAECLLLFSRGDVARNLRFLDDLSDPAAKALARSQLERMAAYAEDPGCRRASLLGYFGESWPHPNCGGCDACLDPRESYDATTDACKLLSCVLRIHQHSGFGTGLIHVADVLAGGNTAKVRKWGHSALSTFGIGNDRPRADWVTLGRQLIRHGWLAESSDGFHSITLTTEGRSALKRHEPLTLERPTARAALPMDSAKAGDIPCDDGLFGQLRARRKLLADARNVPPYVIFSDVALRHMARTYPQDDAAMLAIPGVGGRKFADFGADMAAVIANWLLTEPRQAFAALTGEPPRPAKPATAINPTAHQTLALFRGGASLPEIATARNLALSTIESHLATAIALGEPVTPRAFYSEADESLIAAAFEHHGPTLKPVFLALGEKFSYGQLRLFQAFKERENPRR